MAGKPSRNEGLSPSFGPWLERYAKAHGLSKTKFAEKAGIHTQTLLSLFRGESIRVDVHTFARIAEAMNMELGYVLHRAGFEIGADGVNMPRLQRAETLVAAYGEVTEDCRRALAETVQMLDESSTKVAPLDPDELHEIVTLALAKLDTVASRLRAEGYVIESPSSPNRKRVSNPAREKTRWSEDDDRMLLDPNLSIEELAEKLNRTEVAVRIRRYRLIREGNN